MTEDKNEQMTTGKFRGTVLTKLENIEVCLNQKVDRDEFMPVKAIAYGLVGLIMMAVVGAIVAGVIRAIEIIK